MSISVQTRRGFTLLEVLVVVAIIATLATVVIASMSEVKKKSRDVQRLNDLKEVQLALRMYRDSNGSYPSTANQWWTVCKNGSDTVDHPNGYIPNLAPTFIPSLPTDPSGCFNGSYHGYIYNSNGTDYKFATDWQDETGKNCKTGEEFNDAYRPNPSNGYYFCSVSTSGAKNW